MRILIADDDPVSRRVLDAALVQWGHAVTICTDGTQAWAELRREDTPRLAVLNWMLPGVSGDELCRRVRARHRSRRIHLILLTARDSKEDIVAGLQAGADDYITKPFDREELHARIQAGLRVVDLQERVLEAERVRVLLQTAGAAAHEINQPLTVVVALTELMLNDTSEDAPEFSGIETLWDAAQKIDGIVRRMPPPRD